jgi:hypothetical protein
MKNAMIIAAFAGTALFASCRTYDANDADVVRNEGSVQTAHEATIDSLKLELAKQRIIDSMTEVARLNNGAVLVPSSSVARTTSAPRARTTRYRSSTRRARSSNYSNNSYAGNTYEPSYSQPQPVYSQPAPAPAPAQRRGWSAKAKGAVIGAGTGAVSGAIINKRDRVKGGIVGGVLGAGVGTGIGAIIDRRNGR